MKDGKEVMLVSFDLKTKNRRAKIIEYPDHGIELILKSLTKDTGYGIGAYSFINDKKGKIKTTSIGLSKQGAKEVHAILGEYLKNAK